MASKNEFPSQFNWQNTPPFPFVTNNQLSGVTSGVMSGTNTIYSNILNLGRYDNEGIEITWTGTPTGTLQVMASSSGKSFYALTFVPALTQPSGSSGGYLINLNQLPFQYIMLQYTNASGSGVLTAYSQTKAMT